MWLAADTRSPENRLGDVRVGRSAPTSSQWKLDPVASTNIPHGGRAVGPFSPWHLRSYLTLSVTPSWRPSPAPTHLHLLLEPASRPLLPFQQLLQLGHAACGHALCHLLLQLLHPLGVLGPGQPQALGGSIQLPGKRQSGCGLTAQTCRVTTRHRKLILYLVGHPTR